MEDTIASQIAQVAGLASRLIPVHGILESVERRSCNLEATFLTPCFALEIAFQAKASNDRPVFDPENGLDPWYFEWMNIQLVPVAWKRCSMLRQGTSIDVDLTDWNIGSEDI